MVNDGNFCCSIFLSHYNVHTFTNKPVYLWPYTLHNYVAVFNSTYK